MTDKEAKVEIVDGLPEEEKADIAALDKAYREYDEVGKPEGHEGRTSPHLAQRAEAEARAKKGGKVTTERTTTRQIEGGTERSGEAKGNKSYAADLASPSVPADKR